MQRKLRNTELERILQRQDDLAQQVQSQLNFIIHYHYQSKCNLDLEKYFW